MRSLCIGRNVAFIDENVATTISSSLFFIKKKIHYKGNVNSFVSELNERPAATAAAATGFAGPNIPSTIRPHSRESLRYFKFNLVHMMKAVVRLYKWMHYITGKQQSRVVQCSC